MPRNFFARIGDAWARPDEIKIQATFASGVATIDAVESDPGTSITKDTTGDYDITFEGDNKGIHCTGLYIDLASDTPADTVTKDIQPRSLDAAAGTGKLLFFNGDDGDQADPPDSSILYATFKVRRG